MVRPVAFEERCAIRGGARSAEEEAACARTVGDSHAASLETHGAEWVLRQMLQWQIAVHSGTPNTVNAQSPQWQDPENFHSPNAFELLDAAVGVRFFCDAQANGVGRCRVTCQAAPPPRLVGSNSSSSTTTTTALAATTRCEASSP